MDVAALFASAKAASCGDDEKALLAAARASDAEAVARLMTANKSINLSAKCGFSGCTSLHWACEKGSTDIIRLLVEGGASVDTRDGQQWTPLMAAAQKSRVDVVRLLLSLGADATLKAKGSTALNVASSAEVRELLLGARDGKVDAVPGESASASASASLADEVARLVLTAPQRLMIVSGAGVECNLDALEPNESHALCSLICSLGGTHVTTNFSGVALLAQPENVPLDSMAKTPFSSKPFVAVHGTLYDQVQGRGAAAVRRRPRCAADTDTQPLLRGLRPTSVPIPMQDVRDDDPNMIEARCAAARKGTVLILGSSLHKATNGRSLHCLDAASECRRVIFVNPDASRTAAAVADDLGGWGLPALRRGHAHPAAVDCAAVDAVGFAAQVLAAHVQVDGKSMAELRAHCLAWIAVDKVRRSRALFALPPKLDLGAVCDHRFGASRVSVGDVFDRVARLNKCAIAPAVTVAADPDAYADGAGSEQQQARKRKRDV